MATEAHPDDLILIESPDQVEITVEMAGLGSRFLAALVDLILLAIIEVVLFFAAVAVVSFEGLGLGDVASLGLAVMLSLMVIVALGYHIACEMWMNGQSPGKKAVRIRVVRENGQPIRFFDSVLRNLVRLAEMAAGMYAVTFVVLLVSPRRKRLGDYAAGTIVVRMAPEHTPAHFQLDVAQLPLPEDIRRAVQEGVHKVTQHEYEFIALLFDRAKDLPYQEVTRIAVRVAWPLMGRMGIGLTRQQALTANTYFFFLQAVAAAYGQRSAGV